jgi:hypothetical protein
MMPHARAHCQPNPATRRQINAVTSDTEERSALGFQLVADEPDQWVARTASRRIRTPEHWLTAVVFMVGAGFCPGAGATTLRVAEDIAARMAGSQDGTVAYCLDGMVKRLGLSRRCIANHIGFLRVLGLLAWVERGSSLRNALRGRDGFGPGVGFKRSATIYAPVAPPVWDRAHGRRLDGTGYRARVIGVTEQGRALAVAEARAKQGNPPVDNRSSEPVDNSGPCTPSVGVPKPRTSSTVGERSTDTTRKRAARGRGRHSARWTPRQASLAMLKAREVQLHTWWAQGSCVRRFAYSLRPLMAAGWSWEEIGRELGRWKVPLRPRNVAAYVSAEIRRRVNDGSLLLPGSSVRPYRQAPAVEDRYVTWLARRAVEFADRWDTTQHLRAEVRSTAGAGRSPGARIPRGLQDADPSRVLLTSEEIVRLQANAPVYRSGADLWAEVEERAAARIEAEGRLDWWEELSPEELNWRQVYA